MDVINILLTSVRISIRGIFVISILLSANEASGQWIAPEATTGITIVNESSLSFGDVVPTLSGGSVTIDPTGSRSATGVVPFGAGGFGASRFTVTITGSGNPHYTILLPASVTLTGPGATMTVDAFMSDPAGTGMVVRPGDAQQLFVGATLHVGPGQAGGAYSGIFPVIVNLGN